MHKVIYAVMLVTASMLLASCGGGGGGPQAGGVQATTATVGLIITDLSSEDYDHAWATITSVELIDGAGIHQQIFSGEEKVDLLSLRNNLHMFAVNDKVKPGSYSKIRLQVSKLLLVKNNADGSTNEVDVALVANGKIDLNPKGPFEIAAGDVKFASFDWDIATSLKFTTISKGKLSMRPVIFVNVGKSPSFKEGLVRMHGTVNVVAWDLSTIRVCSMLTASSSTPKKMLDDICVDVLVTPKTGVFGADGKPLTIGAMYKGKPITVLGLLRSTQNGDPSPIPLVSGDIAPTPFQIVSIAVEAGPPGTWTHIRGELQSSVDKFGAFSFEPDAGQGYPNKALFEAQAYYESRIFRLDADTGITEVSAFKLAIGDRAMVDAVKVAPAFPGDSFKLRTAVMLSRAGTGRTAEALTGNVGGVYISTDSMILKTPTGDECINTNVNTKVFQLFVSKTSIESREALIVDLTEDSRAVVAGRAYGGGCLTADVIVAEGQTNS
jgi:hypothetical protein